MEQKPNTFSFGGNLGISNFSTDKLMLNLKKVEQKQLEGE